MIDRQDVQEASPGARSPFAGAEPAPSPQAPAAASAGAPDPPPPPGPPDAAAGPSPSAASAASLFAHWAQAPAASASGAGQRPSADASALTPVQADWAPGAAFGAFSVQRRPSGDGLVGTDRLAERLAAERDDRPAGRAVASGEARFRVPTGAEIKSMLAGGSVPEDKLKDSIAMALQRMAKEGKLTSKDPVPTIMAKIFPSAGKFDEKAFEAVVDVTDRNLIYKSVVDAQSKISSTDKPKLEGVMDDAVKLIDQSIADAAGLKQVFGGQANLAKGVYKLAKAAVKQAKADMDKSIDTDYNRDDEQIGLGGWASFRSKHIHLTRKVAEVSDKDEATITIIHECAHLANPSVDDRGYYGSSGFESMIEGLKVANAAHYEELPRRILKKSLFPSLTFKPGVTKSGGKVSFEDEVRREASEYLRKAWDKAVDVHLFLRGVRKDIEAGSTASFAASKARILELSKLEHLTIHHQSAPSTINLNDVVLCEGIARGTVIIKASAAKQAVPAAPASGKTKKDYVDDVITGSIKSYGALTGNDADDRTLMDWLVKEYRKPL